MRCKKAALSLALSIVLVVTITGYAQTVTRIVGSVTAVSGNSLTIKPDKGAPSTLTVKDNARVLRTQPGAKTLAGATPIALTDMAIGDRVLAIANGDTANTVIVMKQADIAQKQHAETAAWQRGAAGLVKTVDVAAGTVTIASGTRTLTIHATPQTIVRRYSPDSAQFADAKLSTLDRIHPGDQLRVRGDRNADGSEITAAEIVAGSFRNIAGMVLSTSPAENTVTINDIATKKPVLIHINPESQLHKLPHTMAKDLAARLKHRGGNGGQGGSDLSNMLENTPTVVLADLHKGNAVMIVATPGTPDSATAVTLLAGVEPILSAFPSGSKSVFSASWNLNGGGAGAGGAGAGGGGAP